MGSVRVRSDTRNLFFDFRYRGLRCREQTTLQDTPANRKKMAEILAKIEAEITLGSFDYARYFPNGKNLPHFASVGIVGSPIQPNGEALPTFGAFAEQWFSQSQVRWRSSTRSLTRHLLDRHILPRFGDTTINAVTRVDLLSYRASLAEPPDNTRKALAPQSINHITGAIRMILAEAALTHSIPDPSIGIKRLKVRKHDIEPFSLEEVKQILGRVRSDYRNYLTARFFTGMRTGEINGLKWRYVDFSRRQILVRETFARGTTEYTKTDGSQREIEMSSVVLQALKEQEQVTRDRSEYVFCDRVGNPIDAKNFTTRVWYPLLRHLDYRPRRPYQCRHTCATFWLAAGENPQWIAAQLGHTTPEMLFRVYARFVPNLTRKDGSAFERLLANFGDAT